MHNSIRMYRIVSKLSNRLHKMVPIYGIKRFHMKVHHNQQSCDLLSYFIDINKCILKNWVTLWFLKLFQLLILIKGFWKTLRCSAIYNFIDTNKSILKNFVQNWIIVYLIGLPVTARALFLCPVCGGHIVCKYGNSTRPFLRNYFAFVAGITKPHEMYDIMK